MNVVKQFSENGLNFISIQNQIGNFKVVLCDLGASLYEVWYDNKLMTVQVEDSNNFWLEGIRFGKTMGRVAGRIANATLTIDGKEYKLETNDWNNCLHSGSTGLAQKKYKLIKANNNAYATTIYYECVSPDGEGGFPGQLHSMVAYTIDAVEGTVKIDYETKCDKKSPVSLTNHTYYCLGDPNISHINMRINADYYLETSPKDKLPTVKTPINKCFDFKQYKNILTDINDPIINTGIKHGYDNYFYFNESDINKPKVEIENDKYHLDIFTDFKGTMVYTNNTPKLRIKCKNTHEMLRKGIAIEPQEDQLKDHIVESEKIVRNWITLKFSKK